MNAPQKSPLSGTVRGAALLMEMDRGALYRDFQRYTGMTPTEFLEGER